MIGELCGGYVPQFVTTGNFWRTLRRLCLPREKGRALFSSVLMNWIFSHFVESTNLDFEDAMFSIHRDLGMEAMERNQQ